MVIGPGSLDSGPLDAPDALGTYGGHDTPRRFRDAEIRQMDEWIDGCSRYLDMIPRYVHLIVPEVLFFFFFGCKGIELLETWKLWECIIELIILENNTLPFGGPPIALFFIDYMKSMICMF